MSISNNEILFSIPIYRQSEVEYYKYLDELDDQNIKYHINQLTRTGMIRDGDTEKIEKDMRNDLYSFSKRTIWKYNQIVGYIELYLDGHRIKAQLWFINSKKLLKIPNKKTFEFKGKISDVVATNLYNNEEITNKINEFLVKLHAGKFGFKYLKKCYFDLTNFKKCIHFIDIKKLIESINSK
jgi:hypothetical protein